MKGREMRKKAEMTPLRYKKPVEENVFHLEEKKFLHDSQGDHVERKKPSIPQELIKSPEPELTKYIQDMTKFLE